MNNNVKWGCDILCDNEADMCSMKIYDMMSISVSELCGMKFESSSDNI